MNGPSVPPAVLFAGAATAQRVLAWRRARATLPAGVLSAASLALIGGAAARFRARVTTINPHTPHRASVLITTGPNACTRNPMYLGLAGLLTAHAIALGAPAALLPVAGFAAYLTRWQIPAEEAALEKIFGAEYARYRDRVPRWVRWPRSVPGAGMSAGSRAFSAGASGS